VLVLLGALPFFLYVAVFLLLPIGVLAVEAFRATDPVTFEESWSTASIEAIAGGPYRRAYVGSLQLSVITAVLGAVFGLALAIAVLRAKRGRLLRRLVLGDTVGDTQGTFYVDGSWARAFAAHAHEIGLLWTTELVAAATAQKLNVREVPVTLIDSHAGVRSRFSWRSAVGPAVGLLRLAARRPSLARQRWPLGTVVPRRAESVR